MSTKIKPEEAKSLQDEAIEDALHQERLDRCVPIAKKILTLLAEENPYIGDVNDKDTGQPKPEANESYNKIAGKVLEVLFEANIRFTEKLFVFSLVKQAAELTEEKVQMSLDNSMQRAESQLWGKDVMELDLQDIDKQLKIKEKAKEDNKK